jgi:hypothetical protein
MYMKKYKLFVGCVVAQRNAPWMIGGALFVFNIVINISAYLLIYIFDGMSLNLQLTQKLGQTPIPLCSLRPLWFNIP